MQDDRDYILIPDKAAEAYSRLRSALFSYQSPPGVFLNIRSLAAKLKVSSTPIREALIKLAFEKVVGFNPRRGYFVKPIDTDDLTANYEMAMVLVKYSIEAGAVTEINEEQGTLMDLLAGASKLDQAQAEIVARYLEGLYDRIVKLSGNTLFISSIRRFNDRTNRIRRYGLSSVEPYYRALPLFHCLEEAVKGGRKEAAVKIIREQHPKTIAALPDLVREMNLRAKDSGVSLEQLL